MKRKSKIPNYGHLAGKHCITARGQRIVAGPYAEISDLNAEMRARFPDKRDPKTGEDVFASYYPTIAENRTWDRMNRALDAFNVEYWSVVEDRRVGNHRLIGYPLSRKFASRQDCRRALSRIKGSNPRAYAGKVTVFFHWLRAKDIADRKVLIDEIRCVTARCRNGINCETEVSHV
jgi:hypothetical protein